MSGLGGTNNLRGNHPGQFIDKSNLIFQLEYRHTFNRLFSDEFSRHGIVYWIGAGTIFDNISNINKAIFNTGFGYRYRLQPQINLRLDIGFGSNNFGIYTGLNEAF
ncbi:MAG: hypothetical protein JW894_12320 [Bacteroidales bacterium]|nr:hypothetical protein [Bacteroidales bacterium]